MLTKDQLQEIMVSLTEIKDMADEAHIMTWNSYTIKPNESYAQFCDDMQTISDIVEKYLDKGI